MRRWSSRRVRAPTRTSACRSYGRRRSGHRSTAPSTSDGRAPRWGRCCGLRRRRGPPGLAGRAGLAGARAGAEVGVPAVAVFQTDLAGFAGRYHLPVGPYVWRHLRRLHDLCALTLAPSSIGHLDTAAHGHRAGPAVGPGRGHPISSPRPTAASGCTGHWPRTGAAGRLHRPASSGEAAAPVGASGPDTRGAGGHHRRRPVPGVVAATLPEATFLGLRQGRESCPSCTPRSTCSSIRAPPRRSARACRRRSPPGYRDRSRGRRPLDLVQHGETGWLWPGGRPAAQRSGGLAACRPAAARGYGRPGPRVGARPRLGPDRRRAARALPVGAAASEDPYRVAAC